MLKDYFHISVRIFFEGGCMKDWEYNELFHAIREAYEELLDEERGYRYAIAKLADEFDNLGKIEGVIVDTAIGEIAVDYHIVFYNKEAKYV